MQSKIDYLYRPNGNLERISHGENFDNLYAGQVGTAVYTVRSDAQSGTPAQAWFPSDTVFINFRRSDGLEISQLMGRDAANNNWIYASNGWETDIKGVLGIGFTVRRFTGNGRYKDHKTEMVNETVHDTPDYTPEGISDDTANDIFNAIGVIAGNVETNTTAIKTLKSDLEDETAARQNADTALSDKIETEKTERTTALTKKADLGGDGKVLTSQLPSYVDDVLEYASKAAFPATGESGKIYVDLTTNLTWRWSGSIYVEISPSLALGETSATAYRGDRGKTAYDHSQASGNPHGTAFSDITGKATQAQLPPLKTVGGESIFGEGNIPTGGTGGNIDEIVEQVVSKIEITFDVI